MNTLRGGVEYGNNMKGQAVVLYKEETGHEKEIYLGGD
jgi:hypothetical protein